MHDDDQGDWIDITTIADVYEVQMDARSSPTRYRHRERGHSEWKQGKPPCAARP